MAPKKKLIKKIIMIGDTGIGKTSFMQMYISRKFSQQYKATIGADFLSKEIDINGTSATLQIWDTAGRERFQSLGVAFYRGADGVFLLYDITNKRSFEAIPQWREEFIVQSGKENVKMVLVGLKVDLEAKRQVQKKDAQQLAACWEIPYVEVSSKDNIRIDEAVRMLADQMSNEDEEEEKLPQPISLSIKPEESSVGFWAGLLDWFAAWFRPTKQSEPPYTSVKVVSGH